MERERAPRPRRVGVAAVELVDRVEEVAVARVERAEVVRGGGAELRAVEELLQRHITPFMVSSRMRSTTSLRSPVFS